MASYSGTSSSGSPNGGALAGRAQELFEIRTPNDFAYSMAAIAWSSQPQSRSSPRNLSAMSFTPGARPTMPAPLSFAAIVPETCVPWKSSSGSWTVLSSWQKSQPLTSSM